MNKQIQQLIKQCTTYYNGGLGTEIEVFDKEKFAELIVQECIDIVNPSSHHQAFAQSYMGGVDGLDLLDSKVTKIKQHFGVEK
jgi:hypothetical protein